MKAKELIEQLKQVDPESDVSFLMDSGCCGDYEELYPYDSEVNTFFDHNKNSSSWVTIRFEPLPGYHSCLQVGGTIRSNNEYWERFMKPDYKHIAPIPEPHEDKKKS